MGGGPPAPPLAPPRAGPPAVPIPGAPSTSPAPSPTASDPRGDLLSSIRSGTTQLKKVSAAPPPVPAPVSPGAANNGIDLNAALKSSLDRYRQFVQEEDEEENEEWDD